MKTTLAPGIEHTRTLTTSVEMGVTHLSPHANVLSTPSMIALMEGTCLEAAAPHLDAHEQTVGTMVHVRHHASMAIGQEITIHCELIERDRRKLLFRVSATHGEKLIGDGTHERFVIDLERFGRG